MQESFFSLKKALLFNCEACMVMSSDGLETNKTNGVFEDRCNLKFD